MKKLVKILGFTEQAELKSAIEQGDYDKVMRLVNANNVLITGEHNGYQPIHSAVFYLENEKFNEIPTGEEGPRKKIIDYLIANGADYAGAKDAQGFTAMHNAIYKGLYLFGDAKNEDDIHYQQAQLYLTVACEMTRNPLYSRAHITQSLEEKITPNRGPQAGISVSLVDLAVFFGADQMTSVLASASVNPCLVNGYGLTTLHMACLTYAYCNRIDSRHQQSLLRDAVKETRLGVLKWLLDHIHEHSEYHHILNRRWTGTFQTDTNNSLLNIKYEGKNETPLQTLIKLNQPELVQIFLESGADPLEKYENENGLLLAKKLGNQKVVDVLEAHAKKQSDNYVAPPAIPVVHDPIRDYLESGRDDEGYLGEHANNINDDDDDDVACSSSLLKMK